MSGASTGSDVGRLLPDLSSAPGAASWSRMVRSQAALEVRLLVRNGEQLLLTVVIPTVLLVLASSVGVVDLGGSHGMTRRIDVVTPGIFGLAVMSTAFTGLAIATGFERRYGVLKRLGASPLPRSGLLAAKALAVLVVETAQVLLLSGVALALGWAPRGSWVALGAAVALLVLGTAAFAALGLLMAGTLKAEVTLAAANLVYLLLLVGGGVLVPLERLPDAVAAGLSLLPSAALGEGLRQALAGQGVAWAALAVLLAWAVGAGALTAKLFRWE